MFRNILFSGALLALITLVTASNVIDLDADNFSEVSDPSAFQNVLTVE